MTMNRDKVTHHRIPLTLTMGEWSMMGFCLHNGEILHDSQAPFVNRSISDHCLLLAAASDRPAATYVSEIARRAQHSDTCRATHAMAAALKTSEIQDVRVVAVLDDVLQQLKDEELQQA
jgi:hypothetical protein